MRTRQAVAGDSCIDCGCIPFAGDTVYLTGLGGTRCANCQGDDEWDEYDWGCEYCRNDGKLTDMNTCPECDAEFE